MIRPSRDTWELYPECRDCVARLSAFYTSNPTFADIHNSSQLSRKNAAESCFRASRQWLLKDPFHIMERDYGIRKATLTRSRNQNTACVPTTYPNAVRREAALASAKSRAANERNVASNANAAITITT